MDQPLENLVGFHVEKVANHYIRCNFFKVNEKVVNFQTKARNFTERWT